MKIQCEYILPNNTRCSRLGRSRHYTKAVWYLCKTHLLICGYKKKQGKNK